MVTANHSYYLHMQDFCLSVYKQIAYDQGHEPYVGQKSTYNVRVWLDVLFVNMYNLEAKSSDGLHKIQAMFP